MTDGFEDDGPDFTYAFGGSPPPSRDSQTNGASIATAHAAEPAADDPIESQSKTEHPLSNDDSEEELSPANDETKPSHDDPAAGDDFFTQRNTTDQPVPAAHHESQEEGSNNVLVVDEERASSSAQEAGIVPKNALTSNSTEEQLQQEGGEALPIPLPEVTVTTDDFEGLVVGQEFTTSQEPQEQGIAVMDHPNGKEEHASAVEEPLPPQKLLQTADGNPQSREGLKHPHLAEEPLVQHGHPQEQSQPMEEHSASEHYEHQSETTVLEMAAQEHAAAPLTQDPEPEPTTLDWGTPDVDFNIGGGSSAGPASDAQSQPAITTTATTSVETTQILEEVKATIDWDDVPDDGFDLGDQTTVQPVQSGDQTGAPKEKDLSELWKQALDDDELLGDTEVDVSAFAFDDDEGFLEETVADLQETTTKSVTAADGVASTASKYSPATAQTRAHAADPQGQQFTEFSQSNQRAVQNPVTAYGAYSQPGPYQQQPVRPSAPSSAQSFVDKKDGYHSPYDLPDDLAKTRRRPAPHHVTVPPLGQPTPPPPRSSSMQSLSRPPPTASSLSPPMSSQSFQTQPVAGGPSRPPQTLRSASSGFFEELPAVSKPRHPAPRSYSPQIISPTPPVAPPPPPQRAGTWSGQQQSEPYTSSVGQLQPPEKLSPFPDTSINPATRTNSLPVPNRYSPAPPATPDVPSRYSPAPPGTASSTAPSAAARYSPAPPPVPAASSRYSPAPPPASASSRYSPAPPPPASVPPSLNRYATDPVGPPRPPVQPFAPRTSSPLAYHEENAQSRPSSSQYTPPEVKQSSRLPEERSGRSLARRPLSEVVETNEETGFGGPISSAVPPIPEKSGTPPPPKSGPASTFTSPRKRSNYAPHPQSGPTSELEFVPPRRSHTQSPRATRKHSYVPVTSADRPASAHGPVPQASSIPPQPAQQMAPAKNSVLPHRRGFSREFDFVPPADEQAGDPLQRWKGHPVFTWGLGGTVVTSFPTQVPRYGGGATQPMIKAGPGEIRIQNMKGIWDLGEDLVKFPGPLKGKGKKKDVSGWIGSRVEAFEKDLQLPDFRHPLTPEVQKRLEEKIVLWKVIRVLVDNDGLLEGSPAIEQTVRAILSGQSDEPAAHGPALTTAADLISDMQISSSQVQGEPVDPRTVDEIHSMLAKGEREKAVWHAVDRRLWAHAMLLASTLKKDIWKQVIQEFVRQEVKKLGGNTKPLAALYTIFAGNWEESVDELVPLSARAGFQMISKNEGLGTVQNALDGLDKWRETLLLVLSNRTDGDIQALVALGKLLARYGRVEAAHVCFVFARSIARISGLDDPLADMVLIGTDHINNPQDVGMDMESVLLTEVYEYALSLQTPAVPVTLPHLQGYKLAHALTLAEHGHRSEAQQYCEAIFATLKASPKGSPYFNGHFIAALDDLSNRLSQSPKDGSSSWISKPSMDKVSGTLWTKFNNFVAGGDEPEDTAANAKPTEAGPFANIAGNTPALGNSPSSSDLYGCFQPSSSMPPAPSTANSRYAPGGTVTPRTSLDQTRGRYDPNPQTASPYPSSRPSMESTDTPYGAGRPSEHSFRDSPKLGSPYTPTSFSPPMNRAQAPRANIYAPVVPAAAETAPFKASYSPNPYQSTPPAEDAAPTPSYQPPQPSYEPPSAQPEEQSGEPASSTDYAPPTSSYEPPTYEPPSGYVPYEPDDEPSSPEEPKPKKKSFMDDDDDDDELARKAAELKRQQKAEADRQADEAFLKAAEADAAKAQGAKNNGKGGGWLTGWFKKGDQSASPGPIKAKLGEESSFVYDPELKRWVNKKAGAENTASHAPPPPPPRSTSSSAMPPHASPPSGPRSSSMPPPMGPPSRTSTPGGPPKPGGPPPPSAAGGAAPPTAAGASSGPPSRPSTSMSMHNASSIDDLLGAPAPRKTGAAGGGGGTVRKGKRGGGRYVDVMAQGK